MNDTALGDDACVQIAAGVVGQPYRRTSAPGEKVLEEMELEEVVEKDRGSDGGEGQVMPGRDQPERLDQEVVGARGIAGCDGVLRFHRRVLRIREEEEAGRRKARATRTLYVVFASLEGAVNNYSRFVRRLRREKKASCFTMR